MRYLLDTHTFLWLAHESISLSEHARTIIADSENVLYLSLASVWELQIKTQLGKLEIKKPLADIVREQEEVNRIELLPITLAHIVGLANLPDHHRDPFDRILIAQAVHESLPIITRDPHIPKYPVRTIW